jgi:DNA-binding response OmpR family regulator
VRILLADDDPEVLEPLATALRREGYEVLAAEDGTQAWEFFITDRPNLAVLDVAMPGVDGMTLTRRIVESGEPRVPVILLTGRAQVRDKVTALDSGADDYVVKPCNYRELAARIRAAWRRVGTPARMLSAGNLALDPPTHRFFVDGGQIEVTINEFKLLMVLMERAGQVVRYKTLMHAVWGISVSSDLLRVTVYRLRHKIEPDPARPRYILTVPGVGFMIPAAAAPAAASGSAERSSH